MAYLFSLGLVVISCLLESCMAQMNGMFCQNIEAMTVLQWCDNKCCGDAKHEYCCDDALNTGAIVGIVFGVIGLIVLVVVIALLLYFCWYKKRDSGYTERSFARYSEKPAPPVEVSTIPEPKAYKEDEVKRNTYEPYTTKVPPKETDDYDDDEYSDDYDEYDDYKTEPHGRKHDDNRKSRPRDDQDGGYMTELKTKIRDSKYRYDYDEDGNGAADPPRARHEHQQSGYGQPGRGYKHSQSSV